MSIFLGVTTLLYGESDGEPSKDAFINQSYSRLDELALPIAKFSRFPLSASSAQIPRPSSFIQHVSSTSPLRYSLKTATQEALRCFQLHLQARIHP